MPAELRLQTEYGVLGHDYTRAPEDAQPMPADDFEPINGLLAARLEAKKMRRYDEADALMAMLDYDKLGMGRRGDGELGCQKPHVCRFTAVRERRPVQVKYGQREQSRRLSQRSTSFVFARRQRLVLADFARASLGKLALWLKSKACPIKALT